jgi:hypothetical protein
VDEVLAALSSLRLTVALLTFVVCIVFAAQLASKEERI